MLEILQYTFMQRALEAGIIVGIICPLIGIFLVLRRYSLMADTLAHVSLAGIAIGLITKINPIVTAFLTAVVSSLFIERLRVTKKVYGESALALFLSGSLALAIVLISLAKGFNADLFSYLFGSIVAVKTSDVFLVALLGVIVLSATIVFYKELVFTSFDEESAKVSGIPTKTVNSLLVILAATTVAVSMRIVGILLVSALIVIPVVASLQLSRSFKQTVIIAECISVFSVVSGIFASYYLNLAAGGTIVIIALCIFLLTLFLKK